MYLANTLLAPLAGFAFTLVLAPIFRFSYDLFTQVLFEAYAATITVYAGLVFYRMRSHPSPKLGTHCLAIGVLGFGAGTVLFGYASVRFLSVGHWLRQLRTDGPRCNLDNNALVVFGDGNLACRTCSRIVRVGIDVPRRWRKIGFSVFAIGVLFSAVLAEIFPNTLSVGIPGYIASLIFVNGLAFVISSVNPQTMGDGRVRMPESS
jgi:hypothetical protein